MRIAISCHPTQGGSGVVATELAAALARRGNEVFVVACELPWRMRETPNLHFVRVNVFDYPLFRHRPHDLCLANRLAGLVKEERIDVIHAHYAVPHAVAAELARQVVAPRPVGIVTTLHGTDITLVGSHADFFDLTRHAMEASDAVTTVSTWLREETQRRFSLSQVPEVIPNFVDPEEFHSRDRSGPPGSDGPIHLVHASNLRPVKRVADVIRVFHKVQEQVDARLTVAGTGPERGLAEELAAELRISDRVRFLEGHRDMGALLRTAHVGLLFSEYESFGLFALESMACGAVPAVSSGGGLPEVVIHGETGLVCPVGEVSCIAGEIVGLVRDPERWRRMSEASAARVTEVFPADRIAARYEAVYERVVKR